MGIASLSASFAGPVELTIGASAVVVLQHGPGLKDQLSGLTQQRVEREAGANGSSIRRSCTIPIGWSCFAALVPLAAVDWAGTDVKTTLEPQIQRAELPLVGTGNGNSIRGNLLGAAGS